MSLKDKIVRGIVALGLVASASYFALRADLKYERLFEEGKRPITGTVLEEFYQNTLVPNPKFSGLMSYSNETVKLESKYTLKLKTDDGRIIGVSIIDGDDWYGIPVKKEALDAIIDKGTRISFPAGNMGHGNLLRGSSRREDPNETCFTPDTQAGNKRADRIKVLDKK